MDEQMMEPSALDAFVQKSMSDTAGAMAILLAYIGDQTGIFRAMAAVGPAEPDRIAEHAGVDPRYLTEFLSACAAGGYVSYDPAEETFSLSPAQAWGLTREGEPGCMQGFFQAAVAQMITVDKAIEVLRSGAGRAWSEHHSCCFCGTDRFFRPGYVAYLVNEWLPALDGVVEKLTAGAKVVDIGCGRGASTVIMAQAFPNSHFLGIDFHGPSIEAAQAQAEAAGVTDRCRFEVRAAKQLIEGDFDLACIFDALHDMGDPVGAAVHIRSNLKSDGTFVIVEPLAGDSLVDNLHLLGQVYYSFSTLVCVPTSRAQEVGLGLGAQAGEARLTRVLNEAGFSQVRRAAETDSNMVLEARV